MVAKNDISDLIRFALTTVFIVLFIVGVAIVAGMLIGRQTLKISVADVTKAVGYKPKPVKEPLIMNFVGDVMLDRGVEYMVNKYGNGSYNFPFLLVAEELKADVVFGNLEGPVSDQGYKAGSIYSFEADPRAIDGLKYAGFNVMSCANNHMLDYTRAALEDTLVRMKNANILCVGAGMNAAEAGAPKYLDVKGNKIAFLGYADFDVPAWLAGEQTSGLARLTAADLENGIQTARKEGADLVIVSFHFGAEYEPAANDRQIEWARAAIDKGADLVIGHHPHVIQPLEEYEADSKQGALAGTIKKENVFKFGQTGEKEEKASNKRGWIVYSLGNFVFDQNFSQETMEGGVLEVKTENGKISDVVLKKAKINSRYQPEIIGQDSKAD
ncbi:MAG TPA: CapA family protein [Candidatus Paceibacterota bacterium]|nr:CapA family protein [Candidatus Pacearchaeota archaeon]HRZ51433.1 CapA family protein [Candidatus Paceibacterota bacterium]HSA37166.1 CapA family protein [Candidatus Paceibacterota bacterium]